MNDKGRTIVKAEIAREHGRHAIILYGERWLIDRDEFGLWIEHEWLSLVGCGDTLIAAEINMLKQAKIIKDEFYDSSTDYEQRIINKLPLTGINSSGYWS